MDSIKVIAAVSLTDDLLVEILSRVPFKSFCRFKCVCKAWLALASDPHYQWKLPKIPTGLFHGRKDSSVAQLVSLSPNDEEINGALTFLPRHEHLEFVDCCNGLALCNYKSSYICPEACRFIVCNPATQEWRSLPDIHIGRVDFACDAFLAFDPSWSAQFHVFKFDGVRELDMSKLQVFSSAPWSPFIDICSPHRFIGGVLYVHTGGDDILGLEVMGSGKPPRHFTVKLPHGHSDLVSGCFGQSSGFLQCALPEESGHTVAVFNLDTCDSYKWSLKYRLSMGNPFGKGELLHGGAEGWFRWCDYQIAALDSERKALFLVDKVQMKLFSYNITTGKLSKIKDGCRTDYLYYVACYSKLPVLSSLDHRQETC
ncbi:hypothetical protein CFC21_009034 [Triticum aestivum]|uniref:F-box domain-containing protein n=2 Tax=Triticum aestivum TaxID=4565 RepID=A0A9R1IT19_WHEAT|nr:hypothetical protein CFC21_009034 [Triticum aestivum]